MAEGESIQDEIRQQQEKLKDASLKEKIKYYTYYYKIHFIVTLGVIIFLAGFLNQLLSKRDIGFSMITLNPDATTVETENFVSEVTEFLQLNTKKEQFYLDTTMNISDSPNAFASEAAYYSVMRLDSMFAAKEVDALTGEASMIEKFAAEDTYMDLRSVLDSELYQKLAEENRIYICMNQNHETIPVAVKISDSEKFSDLRIYESDKNIYAGLAANSEHAARFEQFIVYLYQ